MSGALTPNDESPLARGSVTTPSGRGSVTFSNHDDSIPSRDQRERTHADFQSNRDRESVWQAIGGADPWSARVRPGPALRLISRTYETREGRPGGRPQTRGLPHNSCS